MEITLEWKVVSTGFFDDRVVPVKQLENELNKSSDQGWAVHEIYSSKRDNPVSKERPRQFAFIIILNREKKY